MDTVITPTAGSATVPAAILSPQPAAALPAPAHVHERPMSSREAGAIGGGLVLATLALMTQIVALWPAVAAGTTTAARPGATTHVPFAFGLADAALSPDVVLIDMVLMAGALGALVGVTRRFLYYAGREELTRRDEWSYLRRPLQGAMLALIVYFTLRGGYLGQNETAPVNPYGVAALSALVGLFTRHAISKLTDVFDTLFGKPKEDEHPIVVERDARERRP